MQARSMKMISDEALVRDVQEGSISAFETLVTRYQGKLHSFVSYLVRDSIAAQDIVQESFVSLYKTIDRIDTEKKFSVYLFSMTRNHAISYLRGRKVHEPLEHAMHISTGESPEIVLEQKDEAARIEDALSSIDEKFVRVIRLYYFDNLSYEEVGAYLKIPVNTVRTRLRRAKAALRTALETL